MSSSDADIVTGLRPVPFHKSASSNYQPTRTPHTHMLFRYLKLGQHDHSETQKPATTKNPKENPRKCQATLILVGI